MIQIAEALPSCPNRLWSLVRQVGVTHAVAPLPHDAGPGERPWDIGPLGRMKQRFENAGFILAVIEASPPLHRARIGLEGDEEETEHFCQMVRNMGSLGIPTVCYNWMAGLNWLRTRTEIPDRGGALVTGYFHEDLRNAPLTEYGAVSEAQLWSALERFLDRVVPVAEEAGVNLAMHPDDPPLSPIRGIGRIMRSVENFQRLLQLHPSKRNGITLCQGNFRLMTDDLPGTIRLLGAEGRIHFVHLRDVRGTPEAFQEVFHDVGPTDQLACLRAYREIGFEGVLRPDHVPTLEGDSNETPGYSTLARLHAIGYIQGLRESVYGKAET